MHDFGFGTLHETRYPAGHVIPPHAHDDAKVSLLLAGSLEERVGKHAQQSGPLHVVVKPAGVEHSDLVGPDGARMFTIRFSAASLREHDLRAPEAYEWRLGGELVRSALDSLAAHRSGTPPSDEGPLGILAALESRAPATRSSPRPGWLGRARELLHGEFDRTQSVRAIAQRIGVHPVHFARVFRSAFRCSVVDYRHRLRIQRATGMIQEGLPFASIAQGLGFADQPHFSRVFKRMTGVTPGHWRRLQR